MFCIKCGTQIPDDAVFCPRCGAKQPGDAASNVEAPRSAAPEVQAASEKKKSKKKPLIIGSVILALVAVIVVIAASLGGGTDYEATVRAYTPFKKSQSITFTCGEIFDKYLQDVKWNIQEDDKSADVTVSGSANGTGRELRISMHLEDQGEAVEYSRIRLEYDGNELSGNGFFALFVACDEKDEDLSSYETLVSELDISLTGNKLEGAFSDEASGISFKYPGFWTQRENENEFELINLYSPRNTADHRATIEFGITDDCYGVFTGDEASVKKEVNDTGTFTFMDFMDISAEDVPIKALRCKTEGLNGEDEIVVTVWTLIGQDVYRFALSYTESAAPVYEPVFEAVMDSFTVDPPTLYVTQEQALATAQAWCQDSLEIIDEVPAADLPTWLSEGCYVYEMMRYRMGFAGYLYVDKIDGSIYCSVDLGEEIADVEGVGPEEWWSYFDMVVNSAYTQAPSSFDEAQALVDAWLETHYLSSIMATNVVEERNGQYVFELWGPGEFIGLIYVRGSDGYMTFHDYNSNSYDLEEWYAATYGAYSP